MVSIRPVQISDAEGFMLLNRVVLQETPFMLMEPDEMSDGIEDWEKRIRPFITVNGNAFWVAEDAEGMLVGFLRVRRHAQRRLQHAAVLVIGVKQDYWGQGIGARLIEMAHQWSRESGLMRLELTVMVNNRRAIGLYHKMGYVVEGYRRKSIRYADGSWADEYSMVHFIDAKNG